MCESKRSLAQPSIDQPGWQRPAFVGRFYCSAFKIVSFFPPIHSILLSSPIRTTYNCCIAQDQFRPNSEQNAASTESNRPEDVDYEDVDEYDDDDDKKKEARVERTTNSSSSSSKKK